MTQELWKTADELLCQRLPAAHLPVRLIGMGVSGFDESGLRQKMLFDQDERQKHANLDTVADQIRERFGSSALQRGTSVAHNKHPGQPQ